MKEPSIKIKIRNDLREAMLKDLRRPHKFAAERIGFMLTTCKRFANGSYIIYATDYIPVDDSDYIRDKYVGASISSTAIRKAMQIVLEKNVIISRTLTTIKKMKKKRKEKKNFK